MKVVCEKCGATLDAPDEAEGKTVRCPKCKQTFRVNVLELTEQPRGEPAPVRSTDLEELATASSQPPPRRPLGTPRTPVLTTPERHCIRCDFQGYMPKKWDSWVVPVAVLVALFTFGLGLLILLVPKQHRCPQCGAGFD